MKSGCNDSYKNAGVDVKAGYESNKLIKPLVEKTHSSAVLNTLNNFAGFFSINLNFKEPILVSSTDGVGTKIKIASILNQHSTIGIDCVAMCVNDVVCCGAKPLFFLDYIACGKNNPKKIEQIVSGITEGCIECNLALIGGETAEHPKIMNENDYDLAGFCVGIIEKEKILPKKNQSKGDVLIALPSNGVHSNGFSLIRQIFNEETSNFSSKYGVLNKSLGQTLIEPTKIYVNPILNLLNEIKIKAISHITGGGFFENIPRILQKEFNAILFKNKIKTPPIFKLIQQQGKISNQNMFSTFNMGVGMVLIVSKHDVEKAILNLENSNIKAYVIGELVDGFGKIEIV